MILPWDRLVELALGGYRDLLDELYSAFKDSDRYPDPLRYLTGETSDFSQAFADLLADMGMSAELNGMADPLASLTLNNLPILKDWREQYYDDISRYPKTWLWDGITFPSDTPVWRPVTEKAVKSMKSWKVANRADFDKMSRIEKSRAWTITKINNVKTLKHLKQTLQESIESGDGSRSWYSEVKKDFETSRLGPAAAELVFRVASTKGWHEGQAKLLESAPVGELFPYVNVITINDSRRSQACYMMSYSGLDKTSVYNRRDPAYLKNRTPRHYNCFLPETVIQGRVQKLLKSFYSGKVVEIVTLSGNKLTVTANHPIATAGSFVSACELRKGVNLLAYRSGVKERPDLLGGMGSASDSDISAFSVPSQDEEYKPIAIEQAFRSLSNSQRSLRASPARADYFHGDGMFMNGEVQEISTTRELPVEPISSFLQDGVDRLLAFVRMGLLSIKDACSILHLGIAGNSSLSGLVSGSGLPLSFSDAHKRPFDFLSFGGVSQNDSCRSKAESDYLTTDPAFFTQLVHRSAGSVFLDEIVEIRQYDFSGHVYDAQTEGGWLVANNIVSSNCRCRDSFMTVAQAARAGVAEAEEWLKTGKRPDKFEMVPYFEVPMPKGWIPLSLSLKA